MELTSCPSTNDFIIRQTLIIIQHEWKNACGKKTNKADIDSANDIKDIELHKGYFRMMIKNK